MEGQFLRVSGTRRNRLFLLTLGPEAHRPAYSLGTLDNHQSVSSRTNRV